MVEASRGIRIPGVDEDRRVRGEEPNAALSPDQRIGSRAPGQQGLAEPPVLQGGPAAP